MVARPPTSAVEGRSDNPARRIVGLLFMLALETRALRPTVDTTSDNVIFDPPPTTERETVERAAVPDCDVVGTTAALTLREIAVRDGFVVAFAARSDTVAGALSVDVLEFVDGMTRDAADAA